MVRPRFVDSSSSTDHLVLLRGVICRHGSALFIRRVIDTCASFSGYLAITCAYDIFCSVSRKDVGFDCITRPGWTCSLKSVRYIDTARAFVVEYLIKQWQMLNGSKTHRPLPISNTTLIDTLSKWRLNILKFCIRTSLHIENGSLHSAYS